MCINMKNSNWITGGKVFLKDFKTEDEIESAKLYITAKGVYEAYINNERVGDFIMAPGFTSYNKHHLYQEYNIKDMLCRNNEIIVYVGDGWAKGTLAWEGNSNIYTDTLAIIAKISINYKNGNEETIITDETWKYGDSPVIFDSIYDGEVFDANVVPEFSEFAVVYDASKDALTPNDGEIVKEYEILDPIEFITTPNDEQVIDFGQNMTGYVETIIKNAKKGEKLRLSHAEVLDKDGNFYTENLRSAKAISEYICKDGDQSYKPRFTFMGFRYIKISEAPENVTFRAIVVHSEMKRTGYFDCSNELVNKLFLNTIWGQKGNFLDVPTDCPQRDERLGWTGDAQVFVKAASYNFDVNKFFSKWLIDLAADQRENGIVPHVIPSVLTTDTPDSHGGSAAWGDVAVIAPWQLYLTYGNKEVLERQFESMEKWVNFSRKPGREHFGDWLGLDAEEGSYRGASGEEYIRIAYNAYSTELFIKAGKVLRKDMSKYEALYKEILEEFKNEYSPKTQTEYVLALQFNLAPSKKEEYAKALADMIVENGNKLKTGFVGTPYLLHALSDNGYAELAYTLLLQTDYPSWLYPITMGATTIWEHWDGIKPDGSFWSKDMNSFNHYAYGAVVDWIYEVMAGIKILNDRIIVKPVPDKRLSYAKASIDTVHGKVSSKWSYENDVITYEIELPKKSAVIIDGKEQLLPKGTYKF